MGISRGFPGRRDQEIADEERLQLRDVAVAARAELKKAGAFLALLQ